MLRGHRSCTISERPTPSSTLKIPLSLIIPVHPRNSPVSPIIPVHTQKQGGGGHFSALPLHSSSVISVSSVVNQPSDAVDSNRLKISAANCELPTANCSLASQKPPFCRGIIKYVGAPTFSCLATPISCSRTFLNLKLTTDNLKLPSPCSQGQRDQMGEYRPSQCSTQSTKQGVLGYEAKGAPRGSE
jgi:hypothetical protein